jgi:hypothetical protein
MVEVNDLRHAAPAALSLVLTVADIAADSCRVNSAAFAAIPRCHIHETSGTDGQHRLWIT